MLRGTQRFFDRQSAVHARVKRWQPGSPYLSAESLRSIDRSAFGCRVLRFRSD
jgi:hypothetical protein